MGRISWDNDTFKGHIIILGIYKVPQKLAAIIIIFIPKELNPYPKDRA